MRKSLAIITSAAAIGIASLTVGSVLPVGARDDPPPTEEARGRRHRGAAALEEALASLVEDGTLTQVQADAVRDAVAERVGAHRPGPGHPGIRRAFESAAAVIGIDADELRAAVREGSSVAAVATEHGIERQAVVDAVVAAGRTALEEAVADGRLEQDRADRIAERLPARAERFVDFTRPAG